MNMYTFKAASMPGSVMTTLSRNSEVEGKLLVSPDWESELTYYYKDIWVLVTMKVAQVKSNLNYI